MVLLLDIGNTNIKIGVLENGKIVTTWRIASDHNKTADEFGMVFMDLMSSKAVVTDEQLKQANIPADDWALMRESLLVCIWPVL